MSAYGSQKPAGYRPRAIDALVEERLTQFGALEIAGTRWSGKSWTAAAFAESITRVDDEPTLFAEMPSLALAGKAPHVIDEWQDIPAIWNSVRHAVDDSSNKPGQFILTGSSSPKTDKARHSGAGRISRIRMRTMTLTEIGLTDGTVSLKGLFEGRFEPCHASLDLRDYAQIICHGGWPALVGQSGKRALATVNEYLDLLFDDSMRKLGRDPVLSRRVAYALARNLGTSSTLKTLAADAAAGDRAPTEETIATYLADFESNYFLDELPGWDAPVKSRSRVRTKPKRYLDDPSMASSLLSINPERLLKEGQLLGVLFESLCYHDLAVYVSLLPGATSRSLSYYADAGGLEVDFIVELRDGRWAAFEVKLGEAKVDEAAKNLMRLKAKVAANPAARNPEPAFMAVLTANGHYARRRKEDGVYVIPLAALGA